VRAVKKILKVKDGGVEYIKPVLKKGCRRIPWVDAHVDLTPAHQSCPFGAPGLTNLSPATAINLERVADWLTGVDREKTRTSVFARVMTLLAAPS
jgi:hypothetical protein